MITDNIQQRSIEWYRSRIGYITGSRVADIMSAGKKKDEVFSQTAKAYLYQVAAERIFNSEFLNDDDIFQDYIAQTTFATRAMQWGNEQENAAKNLFMQLAFPNGELTELSSCRHDTIPHFAASPDGAVYTRQGEPLRILEVKCPGLNTYMKYRTLVTDAQSLKNTEPKYYWQMMAEMACTGTSSGFFITYCPWLSKPIHWAEIQRNGQDVETMEQRVLLANQYIENIIEK